MNIQEFGKKLLSMALCLCMALTLLPTAAFADTGVAYLDDKGDAQTYTGDYTTVTTSTAWGTADTTTWYVLSSNVNVGSRITVSGTVNLILTDGCTLTAKNGINVGSGQALTIYGQTAGTGAVMAPSNDHNNAGIGGGGSGGTIIINGGTVTASGGANGNGAGIGGGKSGNGGTITINGGTVTASGGSSGNGAGIGGGSGGSGGTITINGGNVTATGNGDGSLASGGAIDGYGAGIGGGYNGDGGTVAISGGSVTATGGDNGGAGIGGGALCGNSSGTITISGGSVTATGGDDGAGIGGGYRGSGGTITISGGSIQASGSSGASAIGKGPNGSSDGTVTIEPAERNTITVKTSNASIEAVVAVIGSPFIKPATFNYSNADTAGYQYAVIETVSKLATPTNLAWDTTVPGKATWGAVKNASSYSVQLYKDGTTDTDKVGTAQSVTGGTSFDFTAAITTAGTGSYYFIVTAIGNGTTYTDSDSATSAAYAYTAPVIAFSAQPASSTTVTAGSISGSLTAAATVTPSGEAELNWFACDSNGTISGSSLGTGGSFTIPTTLTAGTYYYLCQATYAGAMTVNSNVATVTVWNTHPVTTYSIAVRADPTAGGTVTGGGTYYQNDSVTVAATANSGYLFVKWTEGGTQVSTRASYTFSATADRTLVAVFEADTQTYTVTVNGSHASTTGAGNYAQGDTVYIYAGTRSDYSFDGWTVVSGSVTITNADSKSASFTMPDNAVIVTANWSYNGDSYYTITAAAGAGGSIAPSGSSSVREGLDKTYTITPNTGYVVSDVRVDGVSVGAVKTYTFENVRKDHTIEAAFKPESEANPDTGADNPFTDVKDTDWFFEDVMFVYEKNIMIGTGDTTFSPYLSTTRGMIVTILYRLENEPAVTSACPFDDVAAGMYYTKAITWAADNGIVEGYGNGKFGPDDSITREQLAAILYRYVNYKGYDTTQGGMAIREFDDYDSISGYALTPMTWAVNCGLMQGYDNKLLPQGEATRCQVAAMLRRLSEL